MKSTSSVIETAFSALSEEDMCELLKQAEDQTKEEFEGLFGKPSTQSQQEEMPLD